MKTKNAFLANAGWLAMAILTGCLARSEPVRAEDSIRYVHPETGLNFNGHKMGTNGEAVFLSLDLNSDGAVDFRIGNITPEMEASCSLFAVGTNEMLVQPAGLSPLMEGTLIGQPAQGEWRDTNDTHIGLISVIVLPHDGQATGAIAGAWFGRDAYAGIRFYIDGQPHYGWIHMQHDAILSALTVVDWAYSTQPGASILAGAIGEMALEPPKVQHPGYLRLQWPSAEGFTYQIQAKSRIAETGWTSLDFLLPSTGTSILVDLPIGAGERYYRVLKLE